MSRSYSAGHTGMVGSALMRVMGDRAVVPRRRYDLRSQEQVTDAFLQTEPTCVYLAAAKVGGIGANADDPISFLQDNVRIGINVVEEAAITGVRTLINFGSSCIYPRDAPQPLTEDSLLAGPLEPSNEAYALAKIAVLKLVDYYRVKRALDYVSLMPTNLYGPGDTYHVRRSHVIPAMIMKFERARRESRPTVELWGTGKPLREFLFVDDLAAAAVRVVKTYDFSEGWLNVGSGEEISIEDLADVIADLTGYTGAIRWNTNADHPDGTPRKLLDSSKIRELGWKPKVRLEEGLQIAIEDYRNTH